MDIAAALRQLRPMLAAPEAHLDRIIKLLTAHQKQAEGEILRCCADQALGPLMQRLLASPDRADRLRAVKLLRSIAGRAAAAAALRKLSADPHQGVRRAGARAARRLELLDVAPPTTRLSSPRPPFWDGFKSWFRNALGGNLRRQVRAQLGLPPRAPVAFADWNGPESAARLALALGLPDSSKAPKITRGRSPYVIFKIPKARGGEREICAPRAGLKAIQRKILDLYLAKIPVHEACHGFVRGRSVVTNARPHERAALVLKTDIADFFPSIHFHRVQGLFELLGASRQNARKLAALTTYRPRLADGRVAWPGVLPQGAPTSPAIANLVCRRLDARLAGLARRMEAHYTRYADDLTLSFAREPDDLGRVFWWVNAILQQEGFVENTEKRRLLRPSTRQQVTGVVVNEGARLPRDERRAFRALLANCERHGVASQARGRADFADYLLGYAAYARMVQPALGEGWFTRVQALLARGEGP